MKKTQGFVTEIENFVKTNDANSDGKLDEMEFVQAMKRLAVPSDDGIDTGSNVHEDSIRYSAASRK